MGKDDKGKAGKEEKDSAAATPIVFGVNLHCEGCSRKVKRAIARFQGVDGVTADMAGGKVTVTGSADPWKLKERIELKTHNKVALLSHPADPPKKEANTPTKDAGEKKAEEKKADEKKEKPKKADEKSAEPKETTVVLKIRLHCDGCIDRIRRYILKVKGVKAVSVDAAKDLVTVTGTMNVAKLPDTLKSKFQRGVQVVSSGNKEDGGEKKADKDNKGGGGEKEKKKEDSAEKPKEKKEAPQESKLSEFVNPPAPAMFMDPYRYEYGGGYHVSYGHHVDNMVPSTEMFSDENPNACSVM